MDYQELTRRIRRLDFVRNQQTADAVVKEILGIFASRLPEEHAQKFTARFGDQIMIVGKEGSDIKRTDVVSVSDIIARLRSQYKLSVHQARILVRNVLYYAKEASGGNALVEIRKSLPADWADAIYNA